MCDKSHGRACARIVAARWRPRGGLRPGVVGLDCTMLLADRGRNSQHTAQILEDLALNSQRPTDEEPRPTSDQDDVADVAAAEREML